MAMIDFVRYRISRMRSEKWCLPVRHMMVRIPMKSPGIPT